MSNTSALIEVDQRRQDGQGRVRNDRLVAIPIAARREGHETQPNDLPTRVREELSQFFLAATAPMLTRRPRRSRRIS